jgi:hypothetical protein
MPLGRMIVVDSTAQEREQMLILTAGKYAYHHAHGAKYAEQMVGPHYKGLMST